MATTQIKDGYNGGSDNQLKINADGSINATTSGSSTITGNVNLNGLNAFATTQYQVSTSAVQISIPSGTSSVSIKAITTSGNLVIIGNSGSVTNAIDGTGNGYFLFNGDSIQIDLTNSASLWVIGTASGQVVGVLFAGG